MRPIYNAPKTDEKKKKATSSFLPLHMQHCLKLDIKIYQNMFLSLLRYKTDLI